MGLTTTRYNASSHPPWHHSNCCRLKWGGRRASSSLWILHSSPPLWKNHSSAITWAMAMRGGISHGPEIDRRPTMSCSSVTGRAPCLALGGTWDTRKLVYQRLTRLCCRAEGLALSLFCPIPFQCGYCPRFRMTATINIKIKINMSHCRVYAINCIPCGTYLCLKEPRLVFYPIRFRSSDDQFISTFKRLLDVCQA